MVLRLIKGLRVVYLLFGLSFVSCYSDVQSFKQARSGPEVGGDLFGIELRPEATKLIHELEQHFGKKIVERSLERPHKFAEAGIDPDGTPFVAVNRSKTYDEGIIVHELFHLKLWAESYPTITFEYPVGVLDLSEEYADWIKSGLYDPLEHSIFTQE